jgi:hypothetical protein
VNITDLRTAAARFIAETGRLPKVVHLTPEQLAELTLNARYHGVDPKVRMQQIDGMQIIETDSEGPHFSTGESMQ